MSNQNTQLELAQKLDGYVVNVVENKAIKGFQRAFLMSKAIEELRSMLTTEYMNPIMQLQCSRLGFKTDKDLKKVNGQYVKGDGYPMEIVKDVVIEATLQGYEVCGNQFNIIGGNMYPTQAGLESKLNKTEGLIWSVDTGVPSVNKEYTSAVFQNCVINRQFVGGEKISEVVTIPLKIDNYTSIDAMIGKCKRKAYAILLSRITGETVVDGDIEDLPHIPVTQSFISEPAKEDLQEFTDADLELATESGVSLETIKKGYIVSPEMEAKFNEAKKAK